MYYAYKHTSINWSGSLGNMRLPIDSVPVDSVALQRLRAVPQAL